MKNPDRIITVDKLKRFLDKLKKVFVTKDEAILYDSFFVIGETLYVDGTVDGSTLKVSSKSAHVEGNTLYINN